MGILAAARSHQSRTVGTDEAGLGARHAGAHFHHIHHGNAFGDADHQVDTGIDGFKDGVRRKRWRDEDGRNSGTGFSDGDPRDTNFNLDLQAVRLWATERFGPIPLSLLGHPQGQGRARLLPIRPGVAMEIYLYMPTAPTDKPPILYLATYANFSAPDDAVCAALAGAGYPVYGLDPLRYLLHASLPGRVLPSQLWADLNTLRAALPADPILLGQPVSAGLALLWASGVPSVAATSCAPSSISSLMSTPA